MFPLYRVRAITLRSKLRRRHPDVAHNTKVVRRQPSSKSSLPTIGAKLLPESTVFAVAHRRSIERGTVSYGFSRFAVAYVAVKRYASAVHVEQKKKGKKLRNYHPSTAAFVTNIILLLGPVDDTILCLLCPDKGYLFDFGRREK